MRVCFAEVLLMGLILLPLVAMAELGQALGAGVPRGQFARLSTAFARPRATLAPATMAPPDPGQGQSGPIGRRLHRA